MSESSASSINAIEDQLRRFSHDCVLRRNTYWRMFYSFQRYNNFLSIPLLLVTSLTGLTSVSSASASGAAGSAVMWVTAALGTSSGFLAAVQRYLRYGERAEQCRALAKSYGELARRIEITLDLYEEGAKEGWGIVELGKFAEEVVADIQKLLTETQDMPMDILEKDTSFDDNALSDRKKPNHKKDEPLLLNIDTKM